MRVRAKSVDKSKLTPKEAVYFTPAKRVTPGKEYSVYAVSVYDGLTIVLHVDDLDTPTFSPTYHFDVVDPQLGSDWICTLHNEQPQLVLGPSYIAKDLEAYSGMADMREAQFSEFWRRILRGVVPPPFPGSD
jgi:hypothetical protein